MIPLFSRKVCKFFRELHSNRGMPIVLSGGRFFFFPAHDIGR
nr:MAG TPA: hypothetical protein [Caudoviricetes sp.]